MSEDQNLNQTGANGSKQVEKPQQSSASQQTSSSSSGQTNSSSGTGTTVSSVDTVPTQEAPTIPEEAADDSSWGSLFAIDRCFYPFELREDECTFGRGKDCSYCFDVPSIKHTRHYNSYSKKHFIIKRTVGSSGSHAVLLIDTSMNGVFINGEKLPHHGTRQLCDKDEIAISMDKNKVLLFIDKTQGDDPNLPQPFNEKYIMHKLLGNGAFGEVREALAKFGAGRYAVKILNKQKTIFNSTDKTKIDQDLMKEARLMLSLHHPCVIKVHDIFNSPKSLYIILELACGGELFSRVSNGGPLREPVSKLVFYQMASAIAYLHEHNVTHRDIKPENILLMSDDEECLVKITDFGVSRLVGETSFMKTQAGTPSYLAPELVRTLRGNCQGYTKQVDSWSMGVVLFICLVAYPPFARGRQDTKQDLIQQILHGNYNFNHSKWDKVSEDAKDLVKALLKMDANERITPKKTLDHAWLQDDVMRRKAHLLMSETIVSTPSTNLSLINRIEGRENERSMGLNLILHEVSSTSTKSVEKSQVMRAEKRRLSETSSSGTSSKSSTDTDSLHMQEKHFAAASENQPDVPEPQRPPQGGDMRQL